MPVADPLATRPEGRPGDRPGAAAPDAILGVAAAQAFELARLGGSLEDLLAGHAVAQDLAGRGRVADVVDVAPADLERADPERLGQPVEMGLGRELDLRRPEPAEGSVRWRVRPRRAGRDAHVRAAIRPAGMDRAARQDDRGQRAIRPAVHDDLDVLGDQPAVVGHAGAVADDRRVALRRRRDVLVTVVDHPDRAARLEREERGVEPDDRRVLLLPAEPATGLGLDDTRLRLVHREAPLQRGVDVVRALERAVDGDAAVVGGHRDHRVVLDVELLLVTDPILALEDEVGRGEGRLGVARRQLVGGEHVIRGLGVEDRGERRRSGP